MMFVFSGYRMVSRRCHRTSKDYHSKASIFFKVDILLSSGRSPHPRSSEKSPFQICMFQPVITKNTEKSNRLFPITEKRGQMHSLLNKSVPFAILSRSGDN